MKTATASILIVDDEREILRALQRSLVAHSYRVLTATSGEEALSLLKQQRPDLMVLDLLLPGISGLEVCRKVRATSALPIIVLSVKGAEQDKVLALDLGADDYVAKPFHMNEVLARIRVALRRTQGIAEKTEQCFQAGPLRVNFALRQVELQGRALNLTPTEYNLLTIFIKHRGKLLTRSMLMRQLWGEDGEQDRKHSLHVYVARLRQKIEPVPEHPRFLLNIPAVGYRFQEYEQNNCEGREHGEPS